MSSAEFRAVTLFFKNKTTAERSHEQEGGENQKDSV
jgi:hypothetical protein